MTSLEHKYYLADLDRSAMTTKTLPPLPGGLAVALFLVGLSALVAVTTLA